MAMVTRTLEEVRRRARASRPKRIPKSEDEIGIAAESDPDNPPLTEDQLKRFKPWRERAAAKKTKAFSEDKREFEGK